MIWSAKDLSNALNLEIHPDIYGEAIEFNSNSVTKGDLFIALKGNNDGHNYASHALQNGANAVIISKEVTGLPRDKVIMVADTFLALQQMARYKRQKSTAKFIAITGSSGKTSSKEAAKIILSHFGRTYASRGNFNNYLGVPINLASMPDDTEYAILELGMNHAGEIRELANMVKPDISVITTISEAHLEFFQSMLDITDAKCEIFEGMSKEGIAIINLDNPYYNRILENLKKLSINNIFTFGISPEANCRLELYQQDDQNVHLRYSGTSEIIVPFIPKHFAINYAAILQMASILKLNINIAANQLAKILLTEGRGKIIKAKYQDKNYQLICDYYNANPESLKAALLYLKQVSSNKKVTIMGDMLELGDSSVELHRALVPLIIDSGAKKILLVGDKVKYIYDLLPKKMAKFYFANVDELITKLNELLEGDELVLIKGSRGIKLDKIIQSFQLLS